MSAGATHNDAAARELTRLLAQLDPICHAGVYRFARLADDAEFDPRRVICSLREPEGLSIVAAEDALPETAEAEALRASWITLRVRSSLAAVGLTAAVSRALAEAGISCNVIAGARHDHLFVPLAETAAAMKILEAMQREARTAD